MGPQSANVLWQMPTQTNYGGPVIARDGTVYQGTDFGELLAINPDGSSKWTVSVSNRVSETPAILSDGRIAFADEGRSIYVVNADGTPAWRLDTEDSFGLQPTEGPDGTIYTGNRTNLYALRSDGSIRWSRHFPGIITGAVAVRPNGVVYLAAGYLFAFNPNGSLKWFLDPQGERGLGGTPAVGTDGTIYANAFEPTVYAVNPDGTMKWSYHASVCCTPDVPSSPSIGKDGTIYVGQRIAAIPETVGVMLALNPDGSLKWEAPYGGAPTTPSIGGDGTIYFGSGSQNPPGVYALNPDGSLTWKYEDVELGYFRTPPAIGKGHRLYIGTLKGILAFGP